LVKEDENGYLMVSEPNTWQLIKAIQELDSLRKEQQKEIENLKAENEYLKEDNAKLKTEIKEMKKVICDYYPNKELCKVDEK
jgi:cell division protein FtsB